MNTFDADNGIALLHPAALDYLREKLAELNKRADKLGCPRATLEVLGEKVFHVETTLPGGEVISLDRRYLQVQVTGETPKIAGWEFVASAEMLGLEKLIRTVPGKSVPEAFRGDDFDCQHCNTRRQRKEVFILRHESGEWKQVGRTCLRDFLGGLSPEDALAMAAYLFDVQQATSEAEDWGSEGVCRVPNVLDITEYLAATACVIRRLGWLSRSTAMEGQRTTSDNAWELLNPYIATETDRREFQKWIDSNRLHVSEADVTLAQAVLDWATSQPVQGVSDYLYNVGVACRAGYVTPKTAGIVASAVASYMREVEREAELKRQRAIQRAHVGTVGKRETFDVTVTAMRTFDSYYGTKTLVKMEDNAGNVLVWWASKCVDDIDTGDVLTVKATVKKHDAYNGVPQTEVTRLSVVKVHSTEGEPVAA